MKTTLKLVTLGALAAMGIAGCTGDSVQPTAAGSANIVGTNGDPYSQPAQMRPIEAFTSGQGTWCADYGSGECMLYAKPVQNHLALYEEKNNRTIMVDYAGLTNMYLRQNGGTDYGTIVNGVIREEPMPDGRSRVTVHLNAERALVYMVNGTDVMSSPVWMGVRPIDLLNPANQGVLASVEMTVNYINSAPGLPIPDLMQLVRAPQPGQMLQETRIVVRGNGTTMSGKPVNFQVEQNGPIMPSIPGTDMRYAPPAGQATMTFY